MVGATRFGHGGHRNRNSYVLEEASEERADGQPWVRLQNPEGVQMLTTSRLLRAPDARFGEPEAHIMEMFEHCMYPDQDPNWPLCSNDFNGTAVKTFLRIRRGEEQVATGLWVRLSTALDLEVLNLAHACPRHSVPQREA
jgi:hypothetical protein